MPACFNSKNQFSEWLDLGRTAGEAVTVCDDCSRAYEQEMLSKWRCNRWHWEKVVFFQTRKNRGEK